ncbi:MAG: GNAT family N-acetyltransferase [Candidatus Delongbacteria bacterium]|nr:GNAT family N-acetyltransferase [Candidatus Delongbacteria bacterium]
MQPQQKKEFMDHFPDFVKNPKNKIEPSQQNTVDIEGYYYQASDGSQMAFWECHSDQISKRHTHGFDEYMLCISGEYTACFENKEIVLKPGDELLIPKGTVQWGRCKAGTRTISAFGGKRIFNDQQNISFTPFPIVTTERLVLRQLTSDDAPDIFRLRSDDRVMRFLDRPLARTMEDAGQFIEKIRERLLTNDGITWAITQKPHDSLIGTIGFHTIFKEHFRAEIGYLLHPDYQGQGLMQEALSAVLSYGFQALHLHSVEANVNPNNLASVKLLERNHFVREAYFRENYYYNGRFLDTAIYSLIHREGDASSRGF